MEDRIYGARKKAREERGMDAANVDDTLGRHRQKQAKITREQLKEVGFNGKMELFLTRPNGRMYIKDEHLDIFSRYAYPIIYIGASLYMYFVQYY